ncbi:MAG: hypothetical protein HY301_17415 [Verrucomicrobia bacterium]|nr:hypothetical protein [Verrucomicrobiota bacterium]
MNGILSVTPFAMSQSGFIEWLGEENLCENVDTALVRANELLAQGRVGKK